MGKRTTHGNSTHLLKRKESNSMKNNYTTHNPISRILVLTATPAAQIKFSKAVKAIDGFDAAAEFRQMHNHTLSPGSSERLLAENSGRKTSLTSQPMIPQSLSRPT